VFSLVALPVANPVVSRHWRKLRALTDASQWKSVTGPRLLLIHHCLQTASTELIECGSELQWQYEIVHCAVHLVSRWMHGSAVHPVCYNLCRHGSHKEQPHGNISPVSSTLQLLEFCDIILYMQLPRCTSGPSKCWVDTFSYYFLFLFYLFPPFLSLLPLFSFLSCVLFFVTFCT